MAERESQRVQHVIVHKAPKPWYKRFWVWVLIIIVVSTILGSLGNNNDSNTSPSSSTNTSHTSTTKAATPAAPPKVLLTLSGNGIENSSPFLVTTSQLTVIYSYDCSSDGGSGNFIADLLYGNQSSDNSDDQSIANALSSGATNVTTTIYPQNPGHDYYLSVNSECDWTVTVKG